MMDKNATIPAKSDEIVTKLVKKEAALKRENRLAPEVLLIVTTGGKCGSGGSGGRGGKGGRSPMRDK
jgi:hypothetical protein